VPHDHAHSATDRIGWAFLLNVAFTVVEFVGGVLTNSTAILADAVHDLGDSLSIGLAWLLSRLSTRSPDSFFTYGYHRFSLFGALFNGFVLVVGSLWVLGEAIPRLLEPQRPDAVGMLWLAILGVAVNGYAAYRLSHGNTLNERVLNWHLIEDTLGWVAVLVVAVILLFADWPILDPLLSMAFTLFILVNVVRNIAVTGALIMQAAPDRALHREVVREFLSMDHVSEAHHVHLWSLDGERHVLTAHLLLDTVPDPKQQLALKGEISRRLEPFGFCHTTVELEFPDETCRDVVATDNRQTSASP
jgi:cobalt-zinc-cadmium efflux system protein